MIILRNIENIGSDLLAIGDTILSGLMSWILNFELPTVEKIIYKSIVVFIPKVFEKECLR